LRQNNLTLGGEKHLEKPTSGSLRHMGGEGRNTISFSEMQSKEKNGGQQRGLNQGRIDVGRRRHERSGEQESGQGISKQQ